MSELASKHWLIVLNNIDCTSLLFKLQLYSTDVTPDTDSIDLTNGSVFTTNGDINVNRTISIHDVLNQDNINIVDSPEFDITQELNTNTQTDKNIYIHYNYEEETTIGALKCALKLCDTMTYPNNLHIFHSENGSEWISYQVIDITYLKTYIDENQSDNNYVVFEIIRSLPEKTWALTKCKMFNSSS